MRTFNLEETKRMRDLNPSDVDQLVCVRGMVTRVTPIIPDLKQARQRHTHTPAPGGASGNEG